MSIELNDSIDYGFFVDHLITCSKCNSISYEKYNIYIKDEHKVNEQW